MKNKRKRSRQVGKVIFAAFLKSLNVNKIKSCIYDLNPRCKILHELENIRKYTNRPSKEIGRNTREQYNHFVSIFGSIFNRKRRVIYPDDKSPVTQVNLQKLQTKLNNTSPIVERKWLEEKIKELIQETS